MVDSIRKDRGMDDIEAELDEYEENVSAETFSTIRFRSLNGRKKKPMKAVLAEFKHSAAPS